jgi:hypothetical protein
MKLPFIAVGALAAGLITAPTINADTLGAVCPDRLWMKLSTDANTGQRIVCAGAYPDPILTWESTASGRVSNFNSLPMVGATGSSCAGIPSFTFGESSDGYVVWCSTAGYLPGGSRVSGNGPEWVLYSP